MMIKIMSDEYKDLVTKLDTLKTRLNSNADFSNVASNDVIKTVAISKEISSDIKEVLIVLQTTMATELTTVKTDSFKENLAILEVVGEASKVLGKVIDKLGDLEVKNSQPKKPQWRFLVEYKKPLSVVLVIASLWALGVMNMGAMDHVLNKVTDIAKSVK